jgi:dihydroxyacetone kinase-like predicted kinase
VNGANNPSVRDLLLAINKCLASDVYLFVNDKNVTMAAKEAAKLSGRTVQVLETHDIIGGIAGLFAMRSGGEPLEAASLTRSAQVFFAGKDATVGGTTVLRGKPAASSSGVLYAGGTLSEAAQAALQAMGARDGGLITVYYGGAQKERDAQRLADELRAAFPHADVEYYYGGQKNAEFVVSLDD